MIQIRPLTALDAATLKRVGGGYSSDNKYVVRYSDSATHSRIELHLVALPVPYVKHWNYEDAETLKHYASVLPQGYSSGAFDDDVLVGLIVAEPHRWNRSLWVWEFHVIEGHRRQGIGRQLMESVIHKARMDGMRIVVCETQSTNAAAISVYRKLGFRVEGVDVSYYTNSDYPDGEVAVFMKRRLE